MAEIVCFRIQQGDVSNQARRHALGESTMSYITENPLPGMVLLFAIGVVAFLTGSKQGRAVCGMCLLLIIGLFFLERWLISPGEEVELQVTDMLENFKRSDLPAITQQISQDSPDLVAIAEKGLGLVKLDSGYHIRNIDVTISDSSTDRATAMVRANGTLNLKNSSMSQHFPTYWKMDWQRQQDRWQLKSVQRLNPINGEPLDTFAAQ
ncbi:MAG: hypothetical protein R3C49_14435 [Planctomycetaceae bacterium]